MAIEEQLESEVTFGSDPHHNGDATWSALQPPALEVDREFKVEKIRYPLELARRR